MIAYRPYKGNQRWTRAYWSKSVDIWLGRERRQKDFYSDDVLSVADPVVCATVIRSVFRNEATAVVRYPGKKKRAYEMPRC